MLDKNKEVQGWLQNEEKQRRENLPERELQKREDPQKREPAERREDKHFLFFILFIS